MTYEEYLKHKEIVDSIESNLESYAYLQNNLSKEDLEEYFEFSKCESENEEVGTLEYYDCPICKNKGYISSFTRNKDRTIREFATPCKCIPKRKMFKNLANCGIPLDVFKQLTLENYNAEAEWQQKIKRAATDYLERQNSWFVISGVSGSGKTHIATAIVGKLLKQNKECKYMAWKDEIVRLKANKKSIFDDAQEQFAKDMDEIKNVDVLYIDDFLKNMNNYDKASDLDLAYQIINARYLNNKTTIISTELSKAELNTLDSAICGRISQKSGEYWLQIGSDNKRNYRMRDMYE